MLKSQLTSPCESAILGEMVNTIRLPKRSITSTASHPLQIDRETYYPRNDQIYQYAVGD
jgi:hypothetical protein